MVLWDAKPAPPRVLISRVPLNVATDEVEHSRYDWEAPPLTLSSLEVQSRADQGLEK